MRLEPRCSHCDSEDPKIITLRNPARERYCGRFCLDKGHEAFIRWIRRANAEVAS
jgi:coenzyme F420-reducing hydrogenase beta subunit